MRHLRLPFLLTIVLSVFVGFAWAGSPGPSGASRSHAVNASLDRGAVMLLELSESGQLDVNQIKHLTWNLATVRTSAGVAGEHLRSLDVAERISGEGLMTTAEHAASMIEAWLSRVRTNGASTRSHVGTQRI